MPVNFNAMIQPQIGTAMMEGNAARENSMLKDQQMANSQQEMAMRQQKFGQEKAEYDYLVGERKRVADAMAEFNKHLEDSGGIPGIEGYRMLIKTRDPNLVKMGMTGFQMLADEKQLQDIFDRIHGKNNTSTPSQPRNNVGMTYAPTQGPQNAQGRPSLLPQPENFSVAPPTNALAAPQNNVGMTLEPTNALAAPQSRAPRNGYTQDDLIALASARDPRGKDIATLLSGSKSLGAEYLQLSDRYKLLDPKSPEAIDIRKRMDYMTSIEGKQQPRDIVLPSAGPGQPAIAIRIMPNGTTTQIPLDSVKPEPPKSETDKRYDAHVQTEEAAGRVPLPRDQWANEQVRLQAEARADVDVKKKLDIEHPKAIKSVKYIETAVDKDIRLIDAILANPNGISQITGPLAGRVDDKDFIFGRGGRETLANFRTLEASGTLNGVTDLKNNGGTLGQVSNQEGNTLRVARTTATQRTQDADSVIKALKQYRADLELAKTRIKESYDKTYSYRNRKPSVDPKMPGWGQ